MGSNVVGLSGTGAKAGRALKVGALAAVIAIGVSSAVEARTVTHGFFRITDDAPEDISSYLQVSVLEEFESIGIGAATVGEDQVAFRFDKLGPPYDDYSFIHSVYFDGVGLFETSSIIEGSGVDFIPGGGNLPGGVPTGDFNAIDFTATAAFSAVGQGGSDEGVNDGEQLAIVFDLNTSAGVTYDTVLDALQLGFANVKGPDVEGALRIGVHVRNIPGSPPIHHDSFVAVPLPAAVWIMAAALGGFGFAGWRRHRTAS